jgi:hypothetical protein
MRLERNGRIREELDKVEAVLDRDDKRRVLRQMNQRQLDGLRLWHFGAGWRSREAMDVPLQKIGTWIRCYLKRTDFASPRPLFSIRVKASLDRRLVA